MIRTLREATIAQAVLVVLGIVVLVAVIIHIIQDQTKGAS